MKKTITVITLLLVIFISSFPLSACLFKKESTNSSLFENIQNSIVQNENKNKETENLSFSTLENGTYSIAGYYGEETNIVIPDKHNNIDVTAIGEEAFANSEIQSITGGNNITTIESNAFSSCYMFKTFDIKGEIDTIETEAFSECTNLETITLPQTVTYIGSKAFYGCSSLNTVTLPENLKNVSDYTFSKCTALTSIELPQSVTSINSGAFSYCESLSNITLPDNLISIGYDAFKGCRSLLKITIPETVTLIQEDAFTSYMTIIVKGSTEGWAGNWCSSYIDVIYSNKNTSVKKVTVKKGTYESSSTSYYAPEQSIYIDDNELELLIESGALLVGKRYTYQINGNVLLCTPLSKGEKIIEAIYDESTESIEWDSYTYYWSTSEKTDRYIYHGLN